MSFAIADRARAASCAESRPCVTLVHRDRRPTVQFPSAIPARHSPLPLPRVAINAIRRWRDEGRNAFASLTQSYSSSSFIFTTRGIRAALSPRFENPINPESRETGLMKTQSFVISRDATSVGVPARWRDRESFVNRVVVCSLAVRPFVAVV